MGGQFAGLCLDDYKGNTLPDAKVVLWTCSKSDSAQQWYWDTVGTAASVHLAGPGGPVLSVNNGKVVLNSTASNPEVEWLPLGDWGLVNVEASSANTGDKGPTLMTLNDPGYSTTLGTQLIIWQRTPGQPTANAQFNMPSTTYARTTYSSRPDSGAGGDNWALDDATWFAAVTSLGGNNYVGSVADDYGTFLTVPGNTAPNGSGSIANVVQGSFNGTSGYSFTADKSPSASNVPAKAFGGPTGPQVGTGTSDWYKLFFPSGTTFGGSGIDGSSSDLNFGVNDPVGWAWTYSACSGSQTWADTARNGSGSGSGDGNITGGC
jgi:hypothetical protein